jgi:hypothetical protein
VIAALRVVRSNDTLVPGLVDAMPDQLAKLRAKMPAGCTELNGS